MIPLTIYLAYVAACIAVVIVPGPTVTVIIANSLSHGARAGLLNVAGTQAGLVIMLGALALGLGTLATHAGALFDWIRIAGALYLVWLGIRMWRSDGRIARAEVTGEPAARTFRAGRYFWQGFAVILSNPKALLFFGAFIPQFVDPARGDPVLQTLMLGVTFMVVATVLDGAYALVAGSAGGWLTRRNVRMLEIASGTFLVGGGIWLALLGRR